MDGGKPLIFIKPYSKTLEKLVEVLQESSEDQGTEIYEIEDVKEAIQIIPQLGQSLIISAHPRKTAQILQAAGKLIKRLQSKVILLTPKPIPRRTTDKFMKVGLTECITEPIAPKTLQYKVNLLLRSIVIKKEEGDYDQKFDSENDKSNDDDMARKQLASTAKEAEQREEVDGEDLYGRADKDEKKKSTYKEESIAGYYKGSAKKKHIESDDEEEDKKENNQEVIEGYYKNKLKKQEEIHSDEEEPKKKKVQLDKDEYDEISKAANLLIEDDEPVEAEQAPPQEKVKEEKKKAVSLDLEDDQLKKEVEKSLDEDSEEVDDIASHHLDLIDDLEESTTEKEEAAPKVQEQKKKTASLDLEEDQPEQEEKESPAAKEKEERKKATSLDLEEDQPEQEEKAPTEKEKEDKKAATKLELEEDQSKDDEDLEGVADELDQLDIKAKTKLDIEEDSADQEEDDQSPAAKEAETKKKATALDLEEDPKQEKEKQVEEQENIYGKKRSKELLLEQEDDLDYGRKKRVEKEKHQVEREIQEREENNRKAEREDQGYTEREVNNKSSGFTENIQDQGGNKADAHSDKLKTHYDSRTGQKHNDDEWREVERERRAEEEFKAEKKNEFAMPEKTEWGEQTIDYSDLKKQFEATSYSLGDKKEVGQFEDGESSKSGIRYAQSVGLESDESTDDTIEEKSQEEEESEGEIFEVDLKSSLTLIKSLNMYYQYSKEREDTVKSILELIRDDMGALVAIKYGKGPHDGKLKIDTIGNWLDEESKNSIINTYSDASSCPLLPSYSDKTFEQKRTSFFYPFTEGITTFAWAQCFLPNGIKEVELKGLEASLETLRGALLDEFYELGGTGPYAEIKKKAEQEKKSSSVAKIGSFFGGLFGKKKKAS